MRVVGIVVLGLIGCHRGGPEPMRVAESAVEWRAVAQDEEAGLAFARAEGELKVLEGMKIGVGPELKISLVRYAGELELVKALYNEVARFRSLKWSRAVLERLRYVNELAERTLDESAPK